jgi:hypothetical protein
MVDSWDIGETVACVGLAVGGLLLSGLGKRRRDVAH